MRRCMVVVVACVLCAVAVAGSASAAVPTLTGGSPHLQGGWNCPISVSVASGPGDDPTDTYTVLWDGAAAPVEPTSGSGGTCQTTADQPALSSPLSCRRQGRQPHACGSRRSGRHAAEVLGDHDYSAPQLASGEAGAADVHTVQARPCHRQAEHDVHPEQSRRGSVPGAQQGGDDPAALDPQVLQLRPPHSALGRRKRSGQAGDTQHPLLGATGLDRGRCRR